MRQAQPHQEVQRVQQVLREGSVHVPEGHQALQPRGGAELAHAVLQRQRARAVHDREGAELLQVQRLLVAPRRQAREPVAGLLELVGRGGEARQVAVLPGEDAVEVGARLVEQPRVPGHRRRVEEDRQPHRALGVGAVEPVAQLLAKGAQRLAPQRVRHHDPARAWRVAEARERVAEGPGHALEVGEVAAVAQQQRVVLVGLQDLLAAALAAHHEQAALCHQGGRREQGPGAREQPRVQLAAQARDALDEDAAAVQQPHHLVDARGRDGQFVDRGRLVDLQRDQVRVPRDEADQVELAEHAHDLIAVAHQQAVHAVAHHQPKRLEDLGVGLHLHEREARHLTHRQLRRGHFAQQRVAQVGGGEDAQARPVAHERVGRAAGRQLAAHRDEVQGAVHVQRLAHVGVAHARSHEREELALRLGGVLRGHRVSWPMPRVAGSVGWPAARGSGPDGGPWRGAGQCPEAPAAPMPVSERTCWARKPALSLRARALPSSTENSQMPTKPMVIENSAGEV